MTKGNLHLNSFASDTFDETERRVKTQQYADGNSVSYEDTSFVTGDSPVVMDINTDLGRKGHTGYIAVDGTGNILVEISKDNGTTWGGQHTVKAGEIVELDNLIIGRIRLTWVSNSSYRIFCA